MTDEAFDNAIRKFTAGQIMAALGCKSTTAYSWLSGERRPPDWQRETWVKKITDATKKSRKRQVVNS